MVYSQIFIEHDVIYNDITTHSVVQNNDIYVGYHGLIELYDDHHHIETIFQ